MKEVVVHLGVDYGTSASKLVLRHPAAAGGEKAYLLSSDGKSTFPSSIAIEGDAIHFGEDRQSTRLGAEALWIESIKMRVASDYQRERQPGFYPAPLPIPAGLTNEDLAIISLWWLLTLGRSLAEPLLGTSLINMGMTLGLPLAFFADRDGLRRIFVRIARSGYALYKSNPARFNRLTFDEAKSKLAEVRVTIAGRGEIAERDVRSWVRSESEAAMLFALQSPRLPAGPYCLVDVGAGTTNASTLKILVGHDAGQAYKSGFSFFGTASTNWGMDSVDASLSTFLARDARTYTELRGRENDEFEKPGALEACFEAITGIRKAQGNAWTDGERKYGALPAEVGAWKHCYLVLFGGGSLVGRVAERLALHLRSAGNHLRPATLEAPSDLFTVDRRPVSKALLPFVLVAYGLSFQGLTVPIVTLPDDIEDFEAVDTWMSEHK